MPLSLKHVTTQSADQRKWKRHSDAASKNRRQYPHTIKTLHKQSCDQLALSKLHTAVYLLFFSPILNCLSIMKVAYLSSFLYHSLSNTIRFTGACMRVRTHTHTHTYTHTHTHTHAHTCHTQSQMHHTHNTHIQTCAQIFHIHNHNLLSPTSIAYFVYLYPYKA